MAVTGISRQSVFQREPACVLCGFPVDSWVDAAASGVEEKNADGDIQISTWYHSCEIMGPKGEEVDTGGIYMFL